jgi:hypothetical protein
MSTAEILNDILTHLQILRSPDDRHVFQTFTDEPRTPIDKHAKIFTGNFHNVDERLQDLQMEGAGVFVQLQIGDSRKSSSIHTARVLFLDFDRKPVPELPHPPSMVVRTANGFHVYYALHPTQDLEAWHAIQCGMAAALGADPACTAVNQVARLAGFWHLKGERFMVKIVHHDPERIYRLEDFSKYKKAAPVDPVFVPSGDILDFPFRRYLIKRALAKVKKVREEGMRYYALRRAAYHLGFFIRFGMSYHYSRQCLRQALHDLAADEWRSIQPLLLKYEKVIDSGLLQGYQDSQIRPTYIPPAQLEKWERRSRQQTLIDRVAQTSFPERFRLIEIKKMYPSYKECFTEREFSQRIAKLLRSHGFSDSKVMGQLVFRKPAFDGGSGE